jgi:glyoxylase-like metal-dependent hydrolase (beta-lactamase superfamily II)
MQTSRTPLSYDVFVAPSKPFAAPPPRFGDPPAWDPVTSRLIFGARDAVLVDTLETVPEATALADWIALHQRKLTTIYITHGDADHFLGLPVLLDRFPDARAMATAATVERMRSDTPQAPNAARARYPGQIAGTIAVPEPLDDGHFDLEGRTWPAARLPTSEDGVSVPAPGSALPLEDLGHRGGAVGWPVVIASASSVTDLLPRRTGCCRP